MAKFHQMVSMERTPQEKAEELVEMQSPPTIASLPDVPYGLRLRLTEVELEKLGIDIADPDDQPEIGDLIHLFCMAQVTSVSMQNTANGRQDCVELSIVAMSAEDEDKEEGPG